MSALSDVANEYKNLSCASGHTLSLGLQIGLEFGSRTLCYSSPPQLGKHAGDAGYVEVTLAETVPRTLSRIYDNTDVVIRERAVVGGSVKTRVCALALSPTGSNFVVQGSTEVNVSGCSLGSNSQDPKGFVVNGARVTIDAGCIDTVGGFSATAGPVLDLECNTIRQNQPPITDPFRDIVFPDPSDLDCVEPVLQDVGGIKTYGPVSGSICFPGARMLLYPFPIRLYLNRAFIS